GSSVFATVRTSTPSSGHCCAHAASTSQGPAKSSSSASSKRAIPTRIVVASHSVKGVVLAGGTGSRLDPLTRITNKHLLPVYDRPMVSFAIEALVRAGVTELMLVTGGTHAGEFFRLLGNGHEHGIDKLLYAYQEKPGGIAEALGFAERFVDRDRVCVMLADNVLEHSFRASADAFAQQEQGARILLARESD